MARNKSETKPKTPSVMECPSCHNDEEFYYVERGEGAYAVAFEGPTIVVDKSAPVDESIDVASFECEACGHKFDAPPGHNVRFDY